MQTGYVMRQWWVSSIKVFVFLLILAVVGLILFRIPLLDSVLRHQLSELGVPDHSFEINELSLSHLRLDDVSLGSDHEFKSKTISANWSMESILSGGIQTVTVDGLRAELDLREGESLLGSLQPLLEKSGDSNGQHNTKAGVAILSTVSINDAQVHLLVGDGGLLLTSSGQIKPGNTDELLFDLEFESAGNLATVNGVFSGSLETNLFPLSNPDALKAQFTLDTAGGVFRSTESVDLSVLTVPMSNKADLQINVSGQTPLAFENLDSWLQAFEGSAAVKLVPDEVGVPERLSGLNGDLVISGDWTHDQGHIRIEKDSWLEVKQLNQGWLIEQGLPAEFDSMMKDGSSTRLRFDEGNQATSQLNTETLAWSVDTNLAGTMMMGEASAQLKSAFQLKLSSDAQLSSFDVQSLEMTTTGFAYGGNTYDRLKLEGEVAGTPDQFSGLLDVSAAASVLQFGELKAQGVTLNLPLSGELKNSNGVLKLREQGDASMKRLTGLEGVEIRSPVKLKFPSAEVSLIREGEAMTLSHTASVSSLALNLRIHSDDGSYTAIDVHPGPLRVSGNTNKDQAYAGELIVSNAQMALPQHDIQLGGLAATVPFEMAKKTLNARFEIREIEHEAEQPYFAPMSFRGTARLKNQRITAKATGGAAELDNLKVQAQHSLRSGKGHVAVKSSPLNFTPGGLQPSKLRPDLEILEEVSGEMVSEARLDWSKKGLSSNGKVNLDGWSFDVGSTRVSGMWAGLEMTDVVSPASKPSQKVEIAMIDVGVPLESFEAVYQIQGDGSPKVALEKARVEVLEGTLDIEPALIDPLSDQADFVLRVNHLNLGSLFELIKVEGLAGSGQLKGRIPVSFSGTQVAIADGQLEATEPGILRLHSEAVSQVLGGRVQNVDMLIEALTEFHYSELTLSLNNSNNNDMVAKLSLLGKNPRVMNGREFQLNINLESNISKILDALVQGYGLSNQALQRALRLR